MNCSKCGNKTKKGKIDETIDVAGLSFKFKKPVFICQSCNNIEIDYTSLKKLFKSIEYKKPMSSSSKKAKGSKFEKQVAKELHEALMMYTHEYKKLFDEIGNPLLKPRKEKSSGAGKVDENTNDVELGLAMKWFPFSIEAKFHACMDYTINNIIAGQMSEIFGAYKQAEEHAKHHKELKPLVVFKANNTKAFCLCKMSDLVNIKEVDFIKKKEYIILLYSDFLKLYLTKAK